MRVELRGVRKSYGELIALEPTDLAPAARKTTALIGSSGCGKSTLLQLIIGLQRPDAGAIEIDGGALTPENARSLRPRMGYVIQDGGLFPHLTASDNVVLMARHLGWPGDRIAARLEALCGLTRFPRDALLRFPTQLSGGQRQRVALMRALMLDPDLLLLDEPLGALDPLIRSELQTDLREIFRQLGKTVIIATHDLGEAGYLADHIVLMREGRIVQAGSLRDLYERPREPFVTEFLQATRNPLDALAVGA